MPGRRSLVAVFLVAASSAIAAEPQAAPKQVLVLADSVQVGILKAAQLEPNDSVQIHFPSLVIADNSGAALANLDGLLGTGKWDLIYVNFGLGDLHYRDPKTRSLRLMGKGVGGVRVSSPAQYEKNLVQLAERLRATGAKVVWGTTTPIVNVGFPVFRHRVIDVHSEEAYNAIAKKVMAAADIPVVDLHGYVMANMGADEKHPYFLEYSQAFSKKNLPLHQPVVDVLRHALGNEPK
jgi:acyl-CoA thioesterase-1